MFNLSDFLNSESFYLIITTRMAAALVLAFLLGTERQLTGKVAGLRTHILVCAGACVFTLLSLYGFKMHVTEGIAGVNDPARIGAQIITGIGFIGAGTIMRTGPNVLGITTAATLWMAAAIGMACGCGLFSIALIATVFTLFVLIFVRRFEKKVLSGYLKKYRNLKINISCDIQNADLVTLLINENFKNITRFEERIGNGSEFIIKLMVVTKLNLITINSIFKKAPYINKIDIQEIYE